MDTLSYYCVKLTKRRSIAWRYFGLLVKAEDYDQCVDNDHVYCSVCFQIVLTSASLSAANFRPITLVQRYKRNAGTGALLVHLRKNHNIQAPIESLAETNKIVDIFPQTKEQPTATNKPLKVTKSAEAGKSDNKANEIQKPSHKGKSKSALCRANKIVDIFPQTKEQSTATNKPLKVTKSAEAGKSNKANEVQKPSHKGKSKSALCRDLALWFCQDMLPFHFTNNHGFIEFAKKYKLCGGNELPEPKSVLKYALSDIYDTALLVLTREVANSPAVVSITIDTWSDMVKQLSYITFTLHFVSNNFVTKTLTLRTCILPHPYTVQNIQNEIKKTVEQFDLKSKSIICITAEGTNIFKACALSKIDCYSCVSYSLHNLVVCDGLNDTPEVKRVVVKAREIVRHLGFRMNDLPQGYIVQYRELMHKLIQVYELLEEDARLPLVFQQTPSQMMTIFSSCIQECPTRWTCILSLLEILVQNEAAINHWLNTLDICELLLNDEEWSLIKEVSEVLCALRTASEVLSGCRFASLNLALLFHAEVLCSLQPDHADSQIVRDFKRNMLNAAEIRFPVSELQVCAALLDPSLRGLQLTDEYLSQNNSSREHFLKKTYESYISEEFEESLCKNTVVSSSGEQPPAWKRIKLELLQKHTGTHRLGVEAEIQQYLSVTTGVEDPLMWWEDHESSFPRLARLAKYILGIPATSIPSERAFTTNDVLWNSKRITLSPAVVDKILFIHENCNDSMYNVMFSNS